jgi:hypothetical protein
LGRGEDVFLVHPQNGGTTSSWIGALVVVGSLQPQNTTFFHFVKGIILISCVRIEML